MVKDYLKDLNNVYQERVYMAKYEAIVADAYVANKEAITTLIHSNETRVFICFCKSGAFCHRVLLARHFESLSATYHGEIYPWYPTKEEPNIIHLGGEHTVTGSCHLLQANGLNI